jgi:hypothetical protein
VRAELKPTAVFETAPGPPKGFWIVLKRCPSRTLDEPLESVVLVPRSHIENSSAALADDAKAAGPNKKATIAKRIVRRPVRHPEKDI